MILKCAIIDDEPLAAQLLESYAQKTPCLELTGTYNSAITAMRDLRESPVDIIFLDIQMPELSGLEFSRLLPRETRIIFVTAFQQYAVEGYKVGALDYLMKPVTYTDFVRATDRALEWFAVLSRKEACEKDRFMYVKSDYKLVRIALDDILYVEGLKDYVRFFLRSGERIISLMSMKKLDEFLPHPEFLRTHRSYIVHMPCAKAIDRLRIVFGDTHIPVSDNFKEDVQRYLDSHTLV